MYKQICSVALACVFLVGCRDDGPLTPLDLSTADMANGGGGGGGGGGGDMAMKTFTETSIVNMRKGKPGSYALSNVVVLGVSSSTNKPSTYVQDAAGGDGSAMQILCATGNSSHPCSIAAMIHKLTRGQTVSLKGTYIKSTNFEEFYLEGDQLTAGAAGTPVAATPVALDQLASGNSKNTVAHWFQYVTVMTPPTFVVYDLSPKELVFQGATACPYQLGFSLIAEGTTGISPAAECAADTQPAGLATPDPTQLLISTDFFNDYKISSDCKCAAKFKNTQVTSAMTTTSVSGILIPDSVYKSNPIVYYQKIAPVVIDDVKLQ